MDIPQSYGTINSETEPSEEVVEKPPSLKSLLGLPVIRAICSSQWMLGFLGACFNTVFVLMSYTDIEDGGLSMNVRLAYIVLTLEQCPLTHYMSYM